jgi:WD40 repeat protein
MDETARTDAESGSATQRTRRLRRGLSALGQRLGLVAEPPGDNVYHGFISYSHRADSALAVALQRGLHRFAKPWYRARALHVFRDDAALSANPDLWSSVRQALDSSRYYILLASPLAAQSEWVAREAQYWLDEKKGLDRILIGLTDGELSFDGTPVSADQNALPPPLREAFVREPRYIDLRWAKSANDLSLSHPQFRDAVAELASPLHGKPKEEISSEEVTQHRRTRRIARAAALSLLTLLIAAVVAAIVAYSQYRSAQARSLAAEATADLVSNPERSVSLALESTQINTSDTAVSALREALARAPRRMVIDSEAGDSAHAAWNPVFNQIAISGPRDTVGLWNPRTGKLIAALHGPDRVTTRSYSENGPLLYSPDGRWIAYVDGRGTVSVWNAQSGRPAAIDQLAGALPTGHPRFRPTTTLIWRGPDQLLVGRDDLARIITFAPSSGRAATLVTLPGDEQLMSLSPDGSKLFLGYNDSQSQQDGGTFDLATDGFVPISVKSTKDHFSGLTVHQACWLRDGKTVVTWDPVEAQDLVLRFWDTATGRETSAIPVSGGTVSAAACGGTARAPWFATGDYGGQAVLRVIGGLDFGLSGHSQFIDDVTASPGDGGYVATASEDGTARIWRAGDGSLVRVLANGSPVNSIQFSPDSGLAMSTDHAGLVKIWDVGIGEPSTVLASAGPGNQYPLGFVRSGSAVYGLQTSVKPPSSSISSAALVTWSSTNGAVTQRLRLPTDITAAKPPCNDALSLIVFCTLTPPSTLVTPIPTGGYRPPIDLAVAMSADGNLVAYAQPGGVSVIGPRGIQIAQVPVTGAVTGLEFARGGDVLLVMSNRDLVVWKPGQRPLPIPQASPPIDAELSADGSTAAAAQIGGQVGVWRTSGGRRLALVHPPPAFRPSDLPASDRKAVPVRVAVSPNGSLVAAGTLWQTISIWRVSDHHLIAAKLVSTPHNQFGGFGAGGPWAIAEITFSGDGSRLLAVDYPAIGAGDAEPAGTAAVFNSRSGQIVQGLQSPGPLGAAANPGVGLSPDGNFLFSGVLGFAPVPPGGHQAAYQVGGQESLVVDLENAGLAPMATTYNDPAPANPWSPDGVHLLVGSRGIYACPACGSVPQLQGAAKLHTGWSRPLSAADDAAPERAPYG